MKLTGDYPSLDVLLHRELHYGPSLMPTLSLVSREW